MKIKLITVGKLKEKYLTMGIDEYSKRIKAFSNLEIIELKDLSMGENPSDKEIEIIKNKEGEDILSKIKSNEYVISLCIEGKMIDSVELANKISEITTYNSSDITFIIGGSYGLSDDVKSRSDYKLSFSRMTFPHQLMRLILLEQIYRAFKILNNSTYHK